MFMVKQHNSFLIYALLSRIKLCRDYALFGGHFWQKFDGRGHENILKDREESFSNVQILFIICTLLDICFNQEKDTRDIGL